MSTVKPFDVTYKLMSTNFKIIDLVSFDEPFLLVTEIHCLSPWKLYIHNSSLDLVCVCFLLISLIMFLLPTHQHTLTHSHTHSLTHSLTAATKCEKCWNKQLPDEGL